MIIQVLLLLFLAALPIFVLGVPLLVFLVCVVFAVAVQIVGIFLIICFWVVMIPAAFIAELIGAIEIRPYKG